MFILECDCLVLVCLLHLSCVCLGCVISLSTGSVCDVRILVLV